jgi:hypothetical protein
MQDHVAGLTFAGEPKQAVQRVDVIVVSVDEDRQGTGSGLQREAVQGARGPLTRIRIPPHAWTVTARLDVLTPAQRVGVNDRARYRASPMRAGRWWCPRTGS